ncbi:MAG: XRE family transcriptional regulator [Gemmobacter sp.]
MIDSPGKRLRLFRDSLGMSQREFAAALGTSHGTVAFIESNKRTPSKDFLVLISDGYGVSADWLLHGVGDMLMPHGAGFGGAGGQARIDPPDLGKPLNGAFVMDGIDYVRVPRLDLDVSAGNGLGPAQDGIADAIALPRDWMMRQRLAADRCALVRVRGDSMAPAIPDGAMILINAAERFAYTPGVYAFTRNGEAFAKRMAITATGPDGRPAGVLLLSDNQAYPPVSVAGPDLDGLVIVGRVRGVFAFF